MEYSSEVRRRLQAPARAGLSQGTGRVTATGEAEDRSLNVWARFQVELAGNVVESLRFEAYGCPHFVAAADWIAERLEGMPVATLGEPVAQPARAALEVPTEKIGKLLVLEDALANCLRAAGVRTN